MTETEFETVVRNAAAENDRLKDRIEELETQLERRGKEPEPGEPGATDDNPLCRGCYRWRLAFAVVIGAACGLFVAALFTLHDPWGRRLAVSITGREGAADVVEYICCVLTAAAPVLAAIVEWKWLLYKNGYQGVFRAIAEMRDAFKRGLGK